MTPESPNLEPLAGAIASISSKKTTQGAACLAFLITSLMPLSDSPTHLFKSNEGRFCACFKRCPAFDYKRNPSLLNNSGCFKGNSTISLIFAFASSKSPISSKVTAGPATYLL